MKESFVMHNSFYEPIKTLKNEQLGKLLRAIFDYTTNGIVTQDSDIIIAFMFIKNQIDIDANKWEETKQKRSEAGRLGGIQRAINNNLGLSSKSKQCLANLSETKQSQANQAVNVNVNDNVNVNVINKEKNIIKKESFKKPTLEEINQYCKERQNNVDAERFYNFYESKGWYVGKNKMKDWKACVRTWEQKQTKVDTLPDWFDKDFKREVNDERKKLAEQLTNGTWKP